MRRIAIYILAIVIPILAQAQAGDGTFQILNLPSSARLAAMGGTNVALQDNDISFAAVNPALLSPLTHNQLSFNYGNYFRDINFANAAYGRNFGDKNYTAYSAAYLDYGKFLGTDENNQETGRFTAKDIVLSASYARFLHPRWTIGLTFKPLISVFERYQTYGFGIDIGTAYTDTIHDLYAGLAFRNVGMTVSTYRSLNGRTYVSSLPWNIEATIIKGFHHAPIRIGMTIHNWQRWNLGYIDNTLSNQINSQTKAAKVFDMMFRHTIFNLEILPMKNMYILVSYNHRRQREMTASGFKTAAGFAFGAGIKVHHFHIDAGFAQYQAGQYAFHATFTTYLGEFGVK